MFLHDGEFGIPFWSSFFHIHIPRVRETVVITNSAIVRSWNIIDEWKTNLMSLAILFSLLCAQHVSDINISIFRNLRLCWWITTSVVLFSVRCVLELWWVWFWVVSVLQASACKTNTIKNRPHQKLQHTANWEQDNRCGNSSTQSQAPEDGYINVRNMLST